MKTVSDRTITPFQLTCILIGSMIGIGVLSLPSDVAKKAGQNGWISAMIGAVYPLYVVFTAAVLQKKYPDQNILMVNTICFGKYIGRLINFTLFMFFSVYITSIASGLDNLLRTFIVAFLINIKPAIILMMIAVYTTHKGLKVLGRTNEMLFYLLILLMLFPLVSFTKGDLKNMLPLSDISLEGIIKGSIESAFSYGGIEIVLLIYPDISDKTKFLRAAVKGVVITSAVYTFATFVTIYYLGINLCTKMYWPFLAVTKTIEIPIINNFRFIFMIIWSVIIFKTISNNYYAASFIAADMFSSQNYKRSSLIIYPVMLIISLLYGDEIHRRALLGKIIPWYTVYIMVYLLVLMMFVLFKSGDKVEKS